MSMQLHEILSCLCLAPTDKTAEGVEKFEIKRPTASWFSSSSEKKTSPPIFQLTFATSKQAQAAHNQIVKQQPKQQDAITQKKSVLTLPFADLIYLLPLDKLTTAGVPEEHLQNMRDTLTQLAALAQAKELQVEGESYPTDNFIKRVIIDMLLGRELDCQVTKSGLTTDDDDSEDETVLSSDGSPPLYLAKNSTMANCTFEQYPSFLARYNVQFSKAFPDCPEIKTLTPDKDDPTLCPGTVKLTFETAGSRRAFIERVNATQAIIYTQSTKSDTDTDVTTVVRQASINSLDTTVSQDESAPHNEYNVTIDRSRLLSLYPSTADDKSSGAHKTAMSHLSESNYINYVRRTLSTNRNSLSASFNDYLAQLSTEHTQNKRVRVLTINPLISTIGNVQIAFPSKETAEIFLERLLYPHPKDANKRPKVKGNKYFRSTQWLIEIPASALYQLLPSAASNQPEDFNGERIKNLLHDIQTLAGTSKATRGNIYLTGATEAIQGNRVEHGYTHALEHIRHKLNRVWLKPHGLLQKLFIDNRYKLLFQEQSGRLQVDKVSVSGTGAVTLTLSDTMSDEDIKQFNVLCATANVRFLCESSASPRDYQFSFRNFTQLTHWLSQHPRFAPISGEHAHLNQVVARQQQKVQIESAIPNDAKWSADMDPSFHQSNHTIFDEMCNLFRAWGESSLCIDPQQGILHTEKPPIRMQFVPVLQYGESDNPKYTASHITTNAYPATGKFKLTNREMIQTLAKHIQAELIRAYYTPDAATAQKNPTISLTITAEPPSLIETVKQELLKIPKLQQRLSLEVVDRDNPAQKVTLKPGPCYVNGELWSLSSSEKDTPPIFRLDPDKPSPSPGIAMGMGPS